MAEFADDVVVALQNALVGTLGTSIFVTSKSRIPNPVPPTGILKLTDTQGLRSERTHNYISRPDRRPMLQVLACAPSSEVARSLARSAHAVLEPIRNVVINGTWYREIDASQEPFDIGLDNNGNAQYVFNILANRRP